MGTNRVLAIAITEYTDEKLNEIQNCERDLRAILEILSDKYLFEDIQFVHKKEETTRKSLYLLLNEYFINSNADDNILLLYAGHGNYNSQLGLSYWQPSDADPTDPSGWININDLLSFMKAAKALHIGVIADSCFSGAIFEPANRGGGIEALSSKKSREALTSGGVETVSDGKKGERSPFANTLIKLLLENEKTEMPFNLFATNTIIHFDKGRKQTPRSGSLSDVGHDGGTFIFELAGKQVAQNDIDDPNAYLRPEMGNMFISIPQNVNVFIDELTTIYRKKIELVRAQKFEDAAALRDIEKIKFEETVSMCMEYVKSITNKIVYSDLEVEISKKLDKEVVAYEREIEAQMKIFDKANAADESRQFSWPSAQESGSPVETFQMPIQITLGDFAALMLPSVNPANKAFLDAQDVFIEAYRKNVLELLKTFKRLQAQSQNSIILNFEENLMEIINSICRYEIRILTGSLTDYINKSIQKGEIELSILNWIRNRE